MRLTEKPKRRAASCCSRLVMNGGDGLLLRLLALDRGDAELAGLELALDPPRPASPLPTSAFLPSMLVEPGEERRRRRGLQARAEDPVLLRDEGVDLGLALADHLERDRLHAAGGEALLDLVPEQRRELEAHQPVEHAARLLGVDHVAGRSSPGFSSALSTALLVISLKVTRCSVARRPCPAPRRCARRSPRPRGPGRGRGRSARRASPPRVSFLTTSFLAASTS